MDRKWPPAADDVGGRGSLCDHVLLPLVEPDLAERHGAHRHVDGGSDEAVDADLAVQTVDVLRRIFTAGEKNTRVTMADKITILLITDCLARL